MGLCETDNFPHFCIFLDKNQAIDRLLDNQNNCCSPVYIFVPISRNFLCGLNQSLVAMAANSLILISTETMAIMQNVVVMHQSWRGTRSSFCYFLLVWLNLITQTQKLCICHVHVCQRYGHFLSSSTTQCFYFYFPGTRLHS